MPHMIEIAKSGRASCRSCKATIAKGDLRLGEEVANQFSSEPAFQWHHLMCAAKKKPSVLKAALSINTSTNNIVIANLAELETEMQIHLKKEKPSHYPYAERAPSGRSSCLECNTAIAKGVLRIAIEREVDTGSFVTKGAGYLHGACAATHLKVDAADLVKTLFDNSPGLDQTDKDALALELSVVS